MIGLIISRQRTPIALASRASFLINSNEELGTACFSSRRCVLSPPSSSYASGWTGKEILWCSTQLPSPLSSRIFFSVPRTFSGAVLLVFPRRPCLFLDSPGARACEPRVLFYFLRFFFGPRRFRAVGRRWWVEKFFGRRQGRDGCLSSGCVLRSGAVCVGGGKECGLVTSSDIGTFSRSRREEKVK